eukprot:jgi/Botrbrau1/16092/Bobra.7_2s0059.1
MFRPETRRKFNLLRDVVHLVCNSRGLKQKARLSIVLRQDVSDLGEAGDTVQVRHGYARNFLIPEKKAVIATHATRTRYAKSAADVQGSLTLARAEEVQQKVLTQVLKRLATAPVEVQAKVLIGDRLREPVTAASISKAVAAGLQVNLPEALLDMAEGVYQTGRYMVPLKIVDAQGKQAFLRVAVLPEEPANVAAPSAPSS